MRGTMSFSHSVCFSIVTLLIQGIVCVEIGNLPNEQHGISGKFHILDSKTIYIEDFNYDGGGPGAWFYYYSPGVTVDRFGGGDTIPVSSEFGQSNGRLRFGNSYNNVDVTVTLPDGVDACDLGTFTIWCEPFNAIFTRIEIPRDIFENNGDDPCTVKGTAIVVPEPPEFDNCIVLDERLHLSWRINYNDSNARFRICGCQSTESSTNQYMGFGLSGNTASTQMFGADPTIAWVDVTNGQPNAVDYYLSAYTQCRAGVGACPDVMDSSGSCTNDVTDIDGTVTDGTQCVSFTREFVTSDSVCDIEFNANSLDQYIVWAIGGLGETAFRHFIRANSSMATVNFGRDPIDECMNVDLVCDSCPPYQNEQFIERQNATFLVRVGPSGNERGYMGITGRAGWGISFHINGTIIPELVVERGKTYTFLIEGGDDPNELSNYHPLYISSSIGGGRLQNTQAERDSENIYAGFNENGDVTAVGQLCELTETPTTSQNTRESCSSNLQDYLDTLSISSACATAQPGILVWTPDENTPDTVYYQCATHLNLGWKIIVLDEGEMFPGEMFPPASGSIVSVSVFLLATLTIALMGLLY